MKIENLTFWEAASTTTVWLQAAHLICEIDDLVLEAATNGEPKQRVFISVKSAISPTTSDPEFSEVISKAWKDTLKLTKLEKEPMAKCTKPKTEPLEKL